MKKKFWHFFSELFFFLILLNSEFRINKIFFLYFQSTTLHFGHIHICTNPNLESLHLRPRCGDAGREVAEGETLLQCAATKWSRLLVTSIVGRKKATNRETLRGSPLWRSRRSSWVAASSWRPLTPPPRTWWPSAKPTNNNLVTLGATRRPGQKESGRMWERGSSSEVVRGHTNVGEGRVRPQRCGLTRVCSAAAEADVIVVISQEAQLPPRGLTWPMISDYYT